MSRVTLIEHPLVAQSLTRLRDKRTQPEGFRRALGEISALLIYEATRTLETRGVRVLTPMGRGTGRVLRREILLVPVLRAGLGMLHAVLPLLPHARVGLIGLRRHERTLQASSYHQSLPARLGRFDVLLMDPMLATGGSAVAALTLLCERGARRIRLVNLIAAPEGIRHVQARYPSVPIFTAAIDRKLNRNGFILPGLGDAGDRLFGV